MSDAGSDIIQCPRCGKPGMCKGGGAWSGDHKVQRYKCWGCGKTKTMSNIPFGTEALPGAGGLMLAGPPKRGRHQTTRRDHAI